MLPKVKTALMKRLKPLKFAEAKSPSSDAEQASLGAGLTTDFQRDPSHSSAGAYEKNWKEPQGPRPELRLVSGGVSESSTSQIAPRNSVIEFFGKLRASRFPVFKWFAVTAYAMAAKAARSNGRRKKGILVDKNFE